VHSSPALDSDGTVYVATDGGRFYALDSASGAKKWEFSPGTGAISGSTAIGPGGVIYFGSASGYFYAVQGGEGLAQTPWPKFRGGPLNLGRAQPPPLLLQLRMEGGAPVLSWLDTGDGFAVERAGSLNPPVVWTAVQGPVTGAQGERRVKVQMDSAAGFFRLRMPEPE
jgi:hypothetical protein